MKKILTLLSLCIVNMVAHAQNDTLLYENFDVDPTANYIPFPFGTDTVWVNLDNDGQPDHDLSLGPAWIWSQGFIGSNDSTGCLISNSWFNSPAAAANWLITPPVEITTSNAVLTWKSAPYQTPYYLDGYKVLISTASNDLLDYTDTVFVAGEYTGGSSSNGGNYAAYTFSSGFIHGLDGTYVEYDTDSARLAGVLRPFSVSLAAYTGQTIYIAFLHDSYDDNLLAIDDVLVLGTAPSGIKEEVFNAKLNLFPNPAKEQMEVSYELPSASVVSFNVYDSRGRKVLSEDKGNQTTGAQQTVLNIKALPSGNYTLQIIAENKASTIKFTKIK